MMTGRHSGWRVPGSGLLGLLAAVMLVATAALGVAPAQTEDKSREGESKDVAKTPVASGRREVSRTVVGLQVFVDPATGRLRQPTPEEARKLAEGLREMFSQSAEGLEVVRHPNGMLSVDLQGRFQHVAIATVNGQGKVSHRCGNDPGSPAALLNGGAGAGANTAPGDATRRNDGKAASRHASSTAEEE